MLELNSLTVSVQSQVRWEREQILSLEWKISLEKSIHALLTSANSINFVF